MYRRSYSVRMARAPAGRYSDAVWQWPWCTARIRALRPRHGLATKEAVMRHASAAAWMGSVCLLAGGALGQSLNIRYGSAPTTPSPGYAAAGLAGVWNSFAA